MPAANLPPAPILRIYRINAGSCNGCDVEVAVTDALTRFEVQRLGLAFTEDPCQADLVLITGPLTVRVREQVLASWAQVPDPKVTVLVGVCAISGGVFRDSYAVCDTLDRELPVHINVPGCPPRPQAVVAGLADAARIWREGPEAPRQPAVLQTAVSGARGALRFDAAACVGCRMCEHVCAGGAIRFSEEPGGLRFTLWHNSCAFCGLCSHYCPAGALTASGQWQLAHRQEEKYRQVEQGLVPLIPCSGCGTPMLPVSRELLRAGYRELSRETDRLRTLCSECRQIKSIAGGRS
jgi:Ni,Fe-hydrogenase III small subunit/Fe-S-cluster-containing hydrogenase component 2